MENTKGIQHNNSGTSNVFTGCFQAWPSASNPHQYNFNHCNKAPKAHCYNVDRLWSLRNRDKSNDFTELKPRKASVCYNPYLSKVSKEVYSFEIGGKLCLNRGQPLDSKSSFKRYRSNNAWLQARRSRLSLLDLSKQIPIGSLIERLSRSNSGKLLNGPA